MGKVAVGVLSAAAVGVLVFQLLTKLPLFRIEKFEVKGNKTLESNDIILYSGITVGENIFTIDKQKIDASLKTEPYVESSEIKRKLPDTIEIKITEKTDAVVIDAGKKVFLDENGEVVALRDDYKQSFVPLITGLELQNPQLLQPVKLKNSINMDEFRAFVKNLVRPEIHKRLNTVTVGKDGSVELLLKDDTVVKLGKFDDMEHKMSFLEKVLEDLAKKKTETKLIDFTKGKRVVVEKLTAADKKLREEAQKKAEEEAAEKEAEEAEKKESEEKTETEEKAKGTTTESQTDQSGSESTVTVTESTSMESTTTETTTTTATESTTTESSQ